MALRYFSIIALFISSMICSSAFADNIRPLSTTNKLPANLPSRIIKTNKQQVFDAIKPFKINESAINYNSKVIVTANNTQNNKASIIAQDINLLGIGWLWLKGNDSGVELYYTMPHGQGALFTCKITSNVTINITDASYSITSNISNPDGNIVFMVPKDTSNGDTDLRVKFSNGKNEDWFWSSCEISPIQY